MSTSFPKDGREWIVNKLLGQSSDDELYYIKLGVGTTAPSNTDSSMETEVHTTNITNNNGSIEKTANNGEIRVSVTVSGGSEVSSPTDITEFGVFTRDTQEMVYHGVRSSPITVNDGEQVTIEFLFNIVKG